MCHFGKIVVCSACGADVPGHEWDGGLHDCPMTIPPIEGETFKEYSARVDEFRRQKRLSEGKEGTA